ncbi:hypothetical protein HNW77_08360 [Komagataeibacter sp. AV436]|uniref:Uncharacterized protein n=1 Tax=Komagataeibacter melomenusus TaxID=2766578 RepID=A0ABX2ADX7_9PROT|nr:hypothetical protein [Komagataeibacter melomenusus]MBV1830676.1 hypothetical protein [Komagataeibacter melomenusus]NPC66400.1 hypothetical protein [Komagataeibacter melomenusus]
MAERPDQGNPHPSQRFVMNRRELAPTPRERRLRLALRVVTVLLLAAALIDLALQYIRHPA